MTRMMMTQQEMIFHYQKNEAQAHCVHNLVSAETYIILDKHQLYLRKNLETFPHIFY